MHHSCAHDILTITWITYFYSKIQIIFKVYFMHDYSYIHDYLHTLIHSFIAILCFYYKLHYSYEILYLWHVYKFHFTILYLQYLDFYTILSLTLLYYRELSLNLGRLLNFKFSTFLVIPLGFYHLLNSELRSDWPIYIYIYNIL